MDGGRKGELERCGGDITSEMRIACSEAHSEIPCKTTLFLKLQQSSAVLAGRYGVVWIALREVEVVMTYFKLFSQHSSGVNGQYKESIRVQGTY